MRKLLIFGSLIFSSFISNAEPTSDKITISQLRPYNTTGTSINHIYLYTNDKPFCDKTMYQIRGDFKGHEQVFATALAALMANKPVKIEITNDSSDCDKPFPIVQSIYIHQ